MPTQSVVIYRSQMEAQADAFWSAHPEYILWFLGILVAVGIGFTVYNRLLNRRIKRGRWM